MRPTPLWIRRGAKEAPAWAIKPLEACGNGLRSLPPKSLKTYRVFWSLTLRPSRKEADRLQGGRSRFQLENSLWWDELGVLLQERVLQTLHFWLWMAQLPVGAPWSEREEAPHGLQPIAWRQPGWRYQHDMDGDTDCVACLVGTLEPENP